MKIIRAENAEHLEKLRRLFEEYWAAQGFSPCFQNFSEELAGLPGKYAPPAGRLALALNGDEAAGCIALRPLDTGRCEIKRLFVRPDFRKAGLGRLLLEWLIIEARHIGYAEMLCDTMPHMTRALALYERLGFEKTGPYADNPTPGAVFLRLRLVPAGEAP